MRKVVLQLERLESKAKVKRQGPIRDVVQWLEEQIHLSEDDETGEYFFALLEHYEFNFPGATFELASDDEAQVITAQAVAIDNTDKCVFRSVFVVGLPDSTLLQRLRKDGHWGAWISEKQLNARVKKKLSEEKVAGEKLEKDQAKLKRKYDRVEKAKLLVGSKTLHEGITADEIAEDCLTRARNITKILLDKTTATVTLRNSDVRRN